MLNLIQKSERFAPVAETMATDLPKGAPTWEDRQVLARAHQDFLALSWSGSKEYPLALTFRKEWSAEEKRFAAMQSRGVRISQAARAAARDAVIKSCRARYDGKADGPYFHEAYIFYKTSEIPPKSLSEVAPCLLNQVKSVPLHHFYLIARHQPVVDPGQQPAFVDWTLEPQSYPDLPALSDGLRKRIYPEQCPPKPEDRKRCVWCWFLVILLTLALLATAGYGAWRAFDDHSDAEPPSPTASEPPRPGGVGEPSRPGSGAAPPADTNQGLAALRADYAVLREEVTALSARGASQEAMVDAARALNALGERLAEPASDTGLDFPPCLGFRTVEGRRVPEYLFTAVIGEAGITTIPRPTRPDGPDLAPYQDQLNFLGRTVDAETFRAGAATLFAKSQAEGCRHYALLAEDAPRDAGAYAERRQAVEDNFYIYRIRG